MCDSAGRPLNPAAPPVVPHFAQPAPDRYNRRARLRALAAVNREYAFVEFSALRAAFQEFFPHRGEARICRSPGRVNLIGEHMDYNGLPVLPMAIAQEIRIAYAPNGGHEINLRCPRDLFPAATFANNEGIAPSAQGAWENYCKAAVQELNKRLKVRQFPGMDILVTGDLPMAKGLSSSSALVVGCALAYLDVLGQQPGDGLSTVELADWMAVAEHFVGTRGGGMDQAVILNGEQGRACKIDFFPLRIERPPVPQDHALVVCDSMVKVEKSGAALVRFNLGPALCHLACALVEKQVREEFDDDITLERLGDLWFGPLCLTHHEAEDVCKRAIPHAKMTLADVAKRLGLSEDNVRKRWLRDLPVPHEGLPLQARLRHQYSEFRRVELGRDALLAGEPKTFGDLMNASHTRCAKDFGISSPELDALVDAARASGAIGARLTGAGFGGSTVNLVPRAKLDRMIEGVTRLYYRDRMGVEGEAPIFVAQPSPGAGYVPN
jgi:N-acetylgalactosamine kinase